jgi:hypothetical protein
MFHELTNMVSCVIFDELYLPSLQAEVRHMKSSPEETRGQADVEV